MMGININDKKQAFTEQILAGVKTVETRQTDSLRPYVGQRVGIVRTGRGKAMLVGFAVVGEPVVYETVAEFRADFDRHHVAAGSAFDIQAGGRKYGYPLTQVEALDVPVAVSSRGIIARNIDGIKIC